jgi:hypothetical protein
MSRDDTSKSRNRKARTTRARSFHGKINMTNQAWFFVADFFHAHDFHADP